MVTCVPQDSCKLSQAVQERSLAGQGIKDAKAQQVKRDQQCAVYVLPVSLGSPSPLGPSRNGSVTNFAVFSHAATSMALVLHNPANGERQEIPMHKSGMLVDSLYCLRSHI